MELGLDGLPRMTAKELAAYLSLTGEERKNFDVVRARRMEEREREERIAREIARLRRMGLPITSVARGIVTIDFNLLARKQQPDDDREGPCFYGVLPERCNF
jgi:hypothetical protein